MQSACGAGADTLQACTNGAGQTEGRVTLKRRGIKLSGVNETGGKITKKRKRYDVSTELKRKTSRRQRYGKKASAKQNLLNL